MQFVTYLRVSTERWGQSGLGLEAQRAAVAAHVLGRGEVAAEFVEVESGKRADRPELVRALAEAKRAGAVLLIAKLDRLARNVAFIANLLESGVEVTAADMPEANRFVLHVMAAVAEQEGRAISERTKAALAAAKARGQDRTAGRLHALTDRQRPGTQSSLHIGRRDQLAAPLRQRQFFILADQPRNFGILYPLLFQRLKLVHFLNVRRLAGGVRSRMGPFRPPSRSPAGVVPGKDFIKRDTARPGQRNRHLLTDLAAANAALVAHIPDGPVIAAHQPHDVGRDNDLKALARPETDGYRLGAGAGTAANPMYRRGNCRGAGNII